ncbi:sulfatase [Botrimarina sp.]|uniref:sulfatase n=1 Tax=Botrimarina sp. TaxID=2795802 RepID=UPI0032ECA966
MICVDDLSDWVGVLGGRPQARTPHIDRLASEALVFTHAYAPATSCAPSRTATLYGMAPHKSGVYGHDDVHKSGAQLPQTQLPLNSVFQNNGYRTVGCGKVFHGASSHRRGWDVYKKDFPGVAADPIPLGPNIKLECGIQATDNDSETSDGKLTDWAISQLQEEHDRPLFLCLGLRKPHLPWDAPKKYYDLYDLESISLPVTPEDDLDDLPAAGRRFAANHVGYGAGSDHPSVVKTEGAWRKLVQAYLATCSFADANVGRMLDALRSSPHADNTIVVVWGDHGWHLGEKQRWRKFSLWERATRTPLIIRAPGTPSIGERVDAPVGLQDLFPTLVDLCGLEIQQPLDGRSLSPLLSDPSLGWDEPTLMTHGPGNFAVRRGPWRLIHYADGSEELYNLGSDPGEFTNLGRDSAFDPRRASLRRHLPERWLYVMGPRFEAFRDAFARSPDDREEW